MDVFIIGVSGAVGSLLGDDLRQRGAAVRGLVRSADQQDQLASRGVRTVIGDLGSMKPEDLAAAVRGADVMVFTAGSNGGAREITDAIDGDAVATATEAARLSGVERFALVSVMPESWRERELGEEVEHYFAVKKRAEVELTGSELDWMILRPSLLLDDPGTGRVSLGPAQMHRGVPRADVAATLAELLQEPTIGRRILELDSGDTLIADAVRACLRTDGRAT